MYTNIAKKIYIKKNQQNAENVIQGQFKKKTIPIPSIPFFPVSMVG